MHNTSNGMSLIIMTFFSHAYNVGIDPINSIYAVLFMYSVLLPVNNTRLKQTYQNILRERERGFLSLHGKNLVV